MTSSVERLKKIEPCRKQWKKHKFTLTLHHSGMLERMSCVKLTPEGLKNTANDGTPWKKKKVKAERELNYNEKQSVRNNMLH